MLNTVVGGDNKETSKKAYLKKVYVLRELAVGRPLLKSKGHLGNKAWVLDICCRF